MDIVVSSGLWLIHLLVVIVSLTLTVRVLLFQPNPATVANAHVWMLISVTYLYVSDFAVSGTDALYNSWYSMNYVNFESAHLILLSTLALSVTGAFLFARFINTTSSPSMSHVAYGVSYPLRVVVLVVFTVYLMVLISSFSFNVGDLIADSLAPRDSRFQSIRFMEQGEQNPLFALLSVMLPTCVGVLSLSIWYNEKWHPVILLCFLVGAYLLFTQGSRTAFTIALVPLMISGVWRVPRRLRVLVFAGVALFGLLLNGVILQLRASGLGALSAQETSFQYHQDNNFALTLHAINEVERNVSRIDAGAMAQLALLNWIPRAVWPGKPSLSDANFQYYRELWWTQGYIGEFVSMFGLEFGIVISVVYFFLCYIVLCYLLSLKSFEMNLVWKFISILYIYMCLRSVLNISGYVYVLMPFVISYIFDRAGPKGGTVAGRSVASR